MRNKDVLDFEVVSKDREIKGFLDILLLNNETEEVELNNGDRKNIFKNKKIPLIKRVNKAHYYFNMIPTEEKTDLYYFEFNYEDPIPSEKEKDKVNFYYLNDFKNYTLKEIMTNIRSKKKKRGWHLNGNLEIISFEYKDLKDNGKLKLEYKKIKGEGTLGFILAITIHFILLFVIFGLFLKNTYHGYTKTDSDEEK